MRPRTIPTPKNPDALNNNMAQLRDPKVDAARQQDLAETKGLRGDDDKQEAQATQTAQPAQLPAVEAARPLAEERRVGVPDDHSTT